MSNRHDSLGMLIRPNAEGKTVGYWPESSLPEEARNWCRILVGKTVTGINEVEVTLWQVGEYNIYSRVV